MNKRKKLFLITLATAVTIPAIVVPAYAERVIATETPVTKNAFKTMKGFTDVSKDYWAYSEIQAMSDKDIIRGYQDGTFNPNKSISRAHVAELFARSLDLPVKRGAKDFKDVPKSHIYYDSIQKVYQAGIFDGRDGEFGPNDNLTRGQMAKILALAFDLPLKSYPVLPFKDVKWEQIYVGAIFAAGITKGSGGKYNPNDTVSRAHYAVFLDRALKKGVSDEYWQDSVPGEVQPTEEIKEQLNRVKRENKDLFKDEAPFHMGTLSSETGHLSAKLYIEGLDALRKANLKFYIPEYYKGTGLGSYRGVMDIKTDGYVHAIDRLKGEGELLVSPDGDNIMFLYDFRSDAVHGLVKEWVNIIYPELTEHVKAMDEKVQEARKGEVLQVGNPNSVFDGNMQAETIGDFRVQMGVDSHYEWASIKITKIK